MTDYPFRFGRCLNPAFGAVLLDMVDLPTVVADFEVSDEPIGGSSRALDGTLRVDRIALKREWPGLVLLPRAPMQTWAVIRRLRRAGGPYLFFDHSIPNLLSANQRLMQGSSWTDAAGAPVTTRGDGAVHLVAGGAVQMGAAVNSDRGLLVPVTAGLPQFFGLTANGTGAWQLSMAIGWYGASGTAALSTSALGTFTFGDGEPVLYLDGSVKANRIGGWAAAPVGAVYAQLRISGVSSSVDVSDPNLMIGVVDQGHAMTVVEITGMPETQHLINQTSLTLSLSEV